MKRTFPIISLLLTASLLLGACDTPDNESVIATAVALTVQAQATPTTETSLQPATPPADPAVSPTITSIASPTVPASARSYENCTSASLISEDPPDLAILVSGQSFLKTWQIQNTSNCTWNTSYKIIFWSGDILGGAYVYNFPQTLPPGETAPVSLLLAAPEAAGNYKGEWMLQTPDGRNFGVGSYQSPIWADIVVVSTEATPTYDVTAVTYTHERQPTSGCPNANVFFYFTATVTFSGPMKEVILQFQHSDGYKAPKIKLEITEATTMTFTDKWSFYRTASQGAKWIRLTQVFPQYVVYDQYDFTYSCP